MLTNNPPEFVSQLSAHIREVGMGFIGGTSYPFPVLIHELEDKIIAEIDAQGEWAEALHAERRATLVTLRDAFAKHMAGHNNPPSTAELFAHEIASLKARIEAFGPITEANAGEARDLIGLAKKLAKDIDAKRDEEKRPHLEAGRQIDATYKPLVDAANAAPSPLSNALLAYVNEQKRIAAEAAEKARRMAEEEARRAAELADDPVLGEDVQDAAKLAQQKAEVAAASVKTVATVKGSEGFRAAGVRKSYKASVTDWAALVAHFAGHPDVRAAAEKAANAAIRAAKGGITIPGVEVIEVESLV